MNKIIVHGHKLTFLINLLPKNQDQNLSSYILRDLDLQNVFQWKVAAMNSSAREEGEVYIPEISLAVAFSNRLWKWISTGGCCMTTANVNAGGCHKPTASANVTFTLAVVI
jgi:F0F1-type ATP synthase membrane subunit a